MIITPMRILSTDNLPVKDNKMNSSQTIGEGVGALVEEEGLLQVSSMVSSS
jgi:hypothetical protein